jgi:hypothetical protein
MRTKAGASTLRFEARIASLPKPLKQQNIRTITVSCRQASGGKQVFRPCRAGAKYLRPRPGSSSRPAPFRPFRFVPARSPDSPPFQPKPGWPTPKLEFARASSGERLVLRSVRGRFAQPNLTALQKRVKDVDACRRGTNRAIPAQESRKLYKSCLSSCRRPVTGGRTHAMILQRNQSHRRGTA